MYYSPSSRSALAEAELEYADDHESCSVFAVFKLRDCEEDAGPGAMSERLRNLLEEERKEGRGVEIMAWTTMAWTLTANMVRDIHLLLTSADTGRYVGNCGPSGDGVLGIAKT